MPKEIHITTLDLDNAAGGHDQVNAIVPLQPAGAGGHDPVNATVYVVLPKSVLEVLKKAPKPTSDDIKTIKKSLEARRDAGQ